MKVIFMNINIYLEDYLGKEITKQATVLGKSRNTIIREAIKDWLTHHEEHEWPACIQTFQGCEESKPFESYRNELTPPKEDPFA